MYGCLNTLLQIRKISVKEITSPVIFDNLRQPIQGGLYDKALGPLDPKDKYVIILFVVMGFMYAKTALIIRQKRKLYSVG